ncbi:MAG TPA: 23S rRNA (cytosine(2499)-C(5))-methyltransferase [Verrucomicrobiales bacterium]|nr:23S rRNA (cytosine(2499)-C(5))-methyltransferase [Verrucomicrobiales bacterium]
MRRGHPWVYSDSIREQSRAGAAGELAVVYDRRDRFLAIGLWDPDSPLRLRVLHCGQPVNLDTNWWRNRLLTAVQRRVGLFDEHTTGFRWIYGESDGWPGLVLDRYGETLVLKLYAAAWLSRLKGLVDLIVEVLQPKRIVLRVSRNVQDAARTAGFLEGQNLYGDDSAERVVFQESGLGFEAEVVRGQKTGFFLDQRENRRRIENEAAGKDVLNVFSFSGGFSLYAARGGARSVTDLDISAHALAQARRNFALNQDHPRIQASRYEQIQEDAFRWLADSPVRQFDIVILDPPSLAKREVERSEAIEAYERLASRGLSRVRPGGLLLSASCSAHVTTEEFFEAVRRAVQVTRRSFTEIATAGHPPDHAATFVEATYLKAIYLRMK